MWPLTTTFRSPWHVLGRLSAIAYTCGTYYRRVQKHGACVKLKKPHPRGERAAFAYSDIYSRIRASSSIYIRTGARTCILVPRESSRHLWRQARRNKSPCSYFILPGRLGDRQFYTLTRD